MTSIYRCALLVLLLAASLPACAAKKNAAEAGAAKAVAPASTEQLLAKPPKGWKLAYQMNNGKTRLTDFVPPKESDSDWTTKLTFEAHADLKGSDPLQVVMAEARSEKKSCSFVQQFNLYTGLENNYRTAARLIMCGRSKFYGKGQVSIFKAIDGNDYFYIIRIVKHIKPFKLNDSGFGRQEMASWSNYFSKITLCDTASKQHPCPKPSHH
jgi:hypothetical protein